MATDFGTDIDCGEDLSPTFALASGRRCLGQAILHRLKTPRGLLQRHPSYGLDLSSYLNETLDTRALLGLQQAILAQCLEDVRVRGAKVAVDASAATRRLRVTIELTTATGPFRLVIESTNLTVSLLEAT